MIRLAVEILQPVQAAKVLIASVDLEIGFHEFRLKSSSSP
jgi:hypothetical protein